MNWGSKGIVQRQDTCLAQAKQGLRCGTPQDLLSLAWSDPQVQRQEYTLSTSEYGHKTKLMNKQKRYKRYPNYKYKSKTIIFASDIKCTKNPKDGIKMLLYNNNKYSKNY